MKITLLEPLDIPEEVLARYQSCLEKRGHQFTAYGEKTTDPAELIPVSYTHLTLPTILLV